MDKTLRSYLAEMLGTFAVVFIGASAVCAHHLFHAESRPGVLGIALAEGFALAAALAVVLPMSDGNTGYLNPAITVMFWVFKKLDGARTLALMGVQLLGAAMAGGLIWLIFRGNEIALADARMGTPHMNLEAWNASGMTLKMVVSGAALEAVLTFLLTLVILATLVDPRAPRLLGPTGKWLTPLWVGLMMAAVVFAGYALTGASVNPARWFGTVIWESTVPALQAQKPLRDHMPYWMGPIIGALLAGGLYTTFILPLEAEPAEKK